MAKASGSDFEDIKEQLACIRADLTALREGRSGVAQGGGRDGVLSVLVDELMQETDIALEKGMVKKCQMKETCKGLFNDFLKGTAEMTARGSVPESLVTKYRNDLAGMKEKAPHSYCSRCFGEVEDLFDRHIRLARSLRVYRTDDEVKGAIGALDEGKVVKDLLEPMANRQRLQILKLLSAKPSSFTSISEMTKLRGGNLLFHLQKLTASGMIIQNQERGDYMITEKGYRALKAISEVCLAALDG